MKKKIIILIIVALLILLIPIPKHLKDGGTIEYNSILYQIIKIHSLNESSPTGYDKGLIIKLFGKTLYSSIEVHTKDNNLKLEEVVDEKGLIFTISMADKDCTPIKLDVYSENRYILYDSYESCRPFQTCTLMLQYLEPKTGTYDYDALKIINNSKEEETRSKYNPKYEIYIGKNNKRYITDNNNKYLNEFLESLDINIDKCATPVYK